MKLPINLNTLYMYINTHNEMQKKELPSLERKKNSTFNCRVSYFHNTFSLKFPFFDLSFV
jgi:hypothetical protein